MKNLKLSDIGKKAPEVFESEDLELFRVKNDYRQEMDSNRDKIKAKIKNLEEKINKHEFKEGMLDKIINTTYTELENLKENEFAKRGQKQTVLVKQLEALSILQDTIMKFEDMIQKYRKILLDIENNKLNSYVKVTSLKKEENVADESIGAVLSELQTLIKESSTPGASMSIIEEIQNELDENNY
jgi:hypothetical protein